MTHTHTPVRPDAAGDAVSVAGFGAAGARGSAAGVGACGGRGFDAPRRWAQPHAPRTLAAFRGRNPRSPQLTIGAAVGGAARVT